MMNKKFWAIFFAVVIMGGSSPDVFAAEHVFWHKSMTDCAAKAVNAAEDLTRLTEMARQARGQIDALYLHWSAGSYAAAFDAYHINIGRCGEVYLTCNALTELKAHTWHRNSRAIGLSLDCMRGGEYDETNGTIWGGQPPTTAQVERLAQVVALLTRELGLEITPQTVMTHAEAAELDDYGLHSGDPDVRWDLLYLYAPHKEYQEPGGDLLRRLAKEKLGAGNK